MTFSSDLISIRFGLNIVELMIGINWLKRLLREKNDNNGYIRKKKTLFSDCNEAIYPPTPTPHVFSLRFKNR